MKKRLAIATCFYPESKPELWAEAAKAGFTDAEIDTNIRKPTAEILAESQKEYDDLKAGGLAPTSFHLPFGDPWDVSSASEEIRKWALGEMLKFIDWCGEHQIPYAILHASFEPIADADRPMRMANAVAAIKEMGAYAAERGVTVAVEDLPRTCLGNCGDDMIALTGNGEFPGVGVCFDVNHLLKESHKDFIEKVGKFIVTTHLSDYDFVDERHWLPGDGDIDWKELNELMEAVGYEGRWLFELGAAKCSPKLGRPVTPKELADRFFEVIGE
ncbi:MAG: sugar phosphate isomerase/epimerase [Oscillospiraceae bacterium]|nr:sugar phosphate isomerase/epimerase [Oscillospiraceae bacterium]